MSEHAVTIIVPDEFWHQQMTASERKKAEARGTLWPRQVKRLIEWINTQPEDVQRQLLQEPPER